MSQIPRAQASWHHPRSTQSRENRQELTGSMGWLKAVSSEPVTSGAFV